MSNKRSIPGYKDENGCYVKASEVLPVDIFSPTPDVSLDDILKRQLTALDRVTRQLTTKSSTGAMSKDEIQSLATVLKITMELKIREKEVLDDMDDEDLKKAADKG